MTFTAIFLAFLVIGLLVQFYLSQKHMKFILAHRNAVPAGFDQQVSLAEHQKAADYSIAKLRIGSLEAVFSAAILILFTLMGGLQFLHQTLLQFIAPGVWQQVALILSLSFITGLLDLPFSWYRQFHLEASFGFNRMTAGIFWLDYIKGALLGLAIGVPLLWVLLTLMAQAGEYWWVLAWVVLVAFVFFATWIGPTYIAPLFNKFKPLDEGPLKEKIQDLLTRCDFISQGLFVMDGSKRSAHGNAYFTGIGKAKRIVFFDTLIEKLSPAEIEAVLAHELGHFKKKHIRKRLITTFIMSLLGLALLGWVSTQAWFYFDLGVTPELDGNNGGLALALFTLALPVFTFFLTPINSFFSRKHEFEADAFASEKTNANDLISALVKLYQDNAATLTPDPTYSAFYDSHPPAPIRIANLRKLS
jgi:STE24 endopeptidase